MNHIKTQRQARKQILNEMKSQQLESIEFSKSGVASVTLNYTGGISAKFNLNTFKSSLKVGLFVDGKRSITIDARNASFYNQSLEDDVYKYSKFFKSIFDKGVDPMELLEHEDPMIVNYVLSAIL